MATKSIINRNKHHLHIQNILSYAQQRFQTITNILNSRTFTRINNNINTTLPDFFLKIFYSPSVLNLHKKMNKTQVN